MFLKQWYSIALNEYAEILLPGIAFSLAKQAEFKRAWKQAEEMILSWRGFLCVCVTKAGLRV